MARSSGILRAYFQTLVVAVLLATFTRAFLVQGVRISSGSMEDTLWVGDHLLVNRFAFGSRSSLFGRLLPTRQIRRGDLLLHRLPGDPSTLLVKRCVGLPGERIELRDGRVVVDDRVLDESAYDRGVTAADAISTQVPAGHYYVLGDRREQSLDSRDWGSVPAGLVLGKPFFSYWSWRATAPPESGALEKLVDLGAHFVSGTRWERTARLVR